MKHRIPDVWSQSELGCAQLLVMRAHVVIFLLLHVGWRFDFVAYSELGVSFARSLCCCMLALTTEG
jgi:hypothetical protein